jgi:hypothetical protein
MVAAVLSVRIRRVAASDVELNVPSDVRLSSSA